MKAITGIEKPDEIEVTMTITMPMRDWKKLGSQLDKPWSYPACDLRERIRGLNSSMEEKVYLLGKDDNA